MPPHLEMPRRIIQIRDNLPLNLRNFLVGNTNNNNPDFRYILARHQVYRIAFLKFTLLYSRLTTGIIRKILEFIVLLAALFSFFTLIYVHFTFVKSSITCLDKYANDLGGTKILRIELKDQRDGDSYSLFDSYYKEHSVRLQEAGLQACPKKIIVSPNQELFRNTTPEHFSFVTDMNDMDELLKCRLNDDNASLGKNIVKNFAEEFSALWDWNPVQSYHIIEYSLEYGFLRLSNTMRRNLNLTVIFVVIDPYKDPCVGGEFHRIIFEQFLGYDELLLSCVRHLAQKNNFKGYVRNVARSLEYIFINDDGWIRSYFTAALVMPVTTFSVSILLRFAHQQLFVACTNIIELVRTRQRRHYHGSPLLTVIFALFGMMAIICSFFHNSTLTLNVTLMVWVADFYDSVCCRALLAKRHFYKFFFLYHYVFYAYYYRFNGLHWQLNLMTSWLFLLHAMMFFFHRFELQFYIQSFEEFRSGGPARRRAASRSRPQPTYQSAGTSTEQSIPVNPLMDNSTSTEQVQSENISSSGLNDRSADISFNSSDSQQIAPMPSESISESGLLAASQGAAADSEKVDGACNTQQSGSNSIQCFPKESNSASLDDVQENIITIPSILNPADSANPQNENLNSNFNILDGLLHSSELNNSNNTDDS